MPTSMTQNEFRNYLRELQEDAYLWPNDYLAWEKPDKTLIMIGVCSPRFDQLLIYETVKLNQDSAPEYVARGYSIAPNVSHWKNGIRYDPIEELVNKVSGCRYLGSWHDHDDFMDSPNSYSKVMACGRWDLAKEQILKQAKKPSLSSQISQAQGKADVQDTPESPSRTPSKSMKEPAARD